MKTLLSLTFLLALVGLNAQNNLVVFSENGEKFFLIVNGVKQNIEAETNVKVTDLIQPTYKAKIIFEDKAKGVVDQNIYFMQAGEPVKNYEFVYSVGMKKKGMYKARPVSAVSIAETKADPSQTVVHYSTTEPTTSNNNVISDGGNSQVNVANDGTSGGNVQVNQTTTQTQTQTNNGNGTTGVGINMNGMGVNINVNDNMGGMNGMTTTTSQTVTTTSTSSGNVNKTSNTNNTTTTQTKPVVDNGSLNTTAAACSAMNTADFNGAKESIKSKSFDDSKLKIAKQILDNNCMSSAQVKEVMNLFSFEQSKLDLAKYAYGRTTDKNNYYKLNDAFTFESSITELDNHIKKSAK